MQTCTRAIGQKAKGSKACSVRYTAGTGASLKKSLPEKVGSRLCEATEKEEQVQVSSDGWMLGRLPF